MDVILSKLDQNTRNQFYEGKHEIIATEVARVCEIKELMYLRPYNNVRNVLFALLERLHSDEIISFIGPKLRRNTTFLCTAVSMNPSIYIRLSYKFRSKKSLALVAAGISERLWEYIPEKMWSDTDVLFAAAVKNGIILKYMSENLRKDYGIAFAAIFSNGLALEYLENVHKECADFVMVAVKQNGLALEFAADSVKQNRDVVYTAVENTGNALQFTPYFYGDKEIVILSLNRLGHKNDLYMYDFMPDHLKQDEEILAAMIKSYGVAVLKAAGWNITRHLVLLAAKNYVLYQDDLDSYEEDPEILSIAMSKNRYAIWCIPNTLVGDARVLNAANSVLKLKNPKTTQIVKAYILLRDHINIHILLDICAVAVYFHK